MMETFCVPCVSCYECFAFFAFSLPYIIRCNFHENGFEFHCSALMKNLSLFGFTSEPNNPKHNHKKILDFLGSLGAQLHNRSTTNGFIWFSFSRNRIGFEWESKNFWII